MCEDYQGPGGGSRPVVGFAAVRTRTTIATVAATIAAGSAAGWPTAARAVDGVRPRSLVTWSDVPCMTVVERNADPIVALDYDISFEDTDHTADEVETGRRHQMIGFCRQHSPQSPLPTWLTQADVDDAASVPLLDPEDIAAEDILDVGTTWTDCSARIVPDDARLPITDAQAAQDVMWDTTGVARGGWSVEGYTWDPPFNQWAPRGGVVAVFDDAAAADNPPVAAISTGELNIFANEIAVIEGCVVAGEGSTLTASWAETVPGPDQVWTTFLEDEPVDATTFALDFVPPEAIVGSAANVRVEITDAMDQTYTAYMGYAIIVLPGGSTGGCDESGGGFLEDPGCETSSGSTTAPTETSTTQGTSDGEDSSGAAPADPKTEPSCGCTAQRSPSAWLLVPIVALARRRRSKN
jgi:hypothetical protein